MSGFAAKAGSESSERRTMRWRHPRSRAIERASSTSPGKIVSESAVTASIRARCLVREALQGASNRCRPSKRPARTLTRAAASCTARGLLRKRRGVHFDHGHQLPPLLCFCSSSLLAARSAPPGPPQASRGAPARLARSSYSTLTRTRRAPSPSICARRESFPFEWKCEFDFPSGPA